MKRTIDSRVLLLLCLPALALGGCAALPSAEAPAAPAISSAIPPKEFSTAYADALGLMRERRYEQAGERLLDITGRYPEFAGPRMNLGLVYLHLGRDADAERALAAAAALDPDSADTQNLLGVAYRKEGRFEDARHAYQRALSLEPDHADTHLNLGILLDLYLNQPEEALRHYQRYRDVRPDDAARVDVWIADLKRASAPGGRSGS